MGQSGASHLRFAQSGSNVGQTEQASWSDKQSKHVSWRIYTQSGFKSQIDDSRKVSRGAGVNACYYAQSNRTLFAHVSNESLDQFCRPD